MNEYIRGIEERIKKIYNTQKESIKAAGKRLKQMIEEDRLIYVYGGGGHTSLVTGELFFRIGGLANIYPIVEYGLTALSQARKFIELERCNGLGSALIDSSGISPGDTLLLFHTIGVNPTCIEAAKEAKTLGAFVIGIASSDWQDQTPEDAVIRSAGKENLRDIVDIYIDDCNTVEDAVVRFDGMDVMMGPVSGIGSFAIAHLIELAAVEECLACGIIPPVWANANTPEGEARNAALMERYRVRVSML